jgi:hypothetical protein
MPRPPEHDTTRGGVYTGAYAKYADWVHGIRGCCRPGLNLVIARIAKAAMYAPPDGIAIGVLKA